MTFSWFPSESWLHQGDVVHLEALDKFNVAVDASDLGGLGGRRYVLGNRAVSSALEVHAS